MDAHPIKKARLKHKLSQAALGLKIGATKGAISKWEAGFALPRAQVAARIAKVLRIDMGAIYSAPAHAKHHEAA